MIRFMVACLLTAIPSGFSGEENDSLEIPISQKALDRTGVLFWRILLPDDLENHEYLSTEWRIGDEIAESGLNFRGIPAGQKVTITLWTASITQYYSDTIAHPSPETVPRPDGIPFVLTYKDENDKLRSRTGVLQVPIGYEEPYGNLATGDFADSGWLMLRCDRSKAKTSAYFAFLEAVWRTTKEKQ